MIHILLVILKIMGIVLLVILGLLLGILLAVLFIPVRYKAEGNYHGQLLLSVCATWFSIFWYSGLSMKAKAWRAVSRFWASGCGTIGKRILPGIWRTVWRPYWEMKNSLCMRNSSRMKSITGRLRRNTGRPIRMDGPVTAGHGRNNRMTASPAGNRLMAHNSMGNTREGRTPTGGKAGQRKIKQGLSLTNRGPVSWKNKRHRSPYQPVNQTYTGKT